MEPVYVCAALRCRRQLNKTASSQKSVLDTIRETVVTATSKSSTIQLSSVGGLQQQLDSAAASCEAQAAHRLGVKPSALQQALLAHGGDPAVAALQDEVTNMNITLEVPLREFTPVFVRVMSAQADALNELARGCDSAADIQAKQSVHEERAMAKALGAGFPLCLFTLNCALHCQQSSQFRAQLQRILEARVEQFKQWGCFQAANAERTYMASLGIKQQSRGVPQRGMMPARF